MLRPDGSARLALALEPTLWERLINLKSEMLTTWAARVALALLPLVVAAPASASTIYAFNFGSAATGSFVTNGAAVDPGYELITSLTLDFVMTDDNVIHTGPFTALSLEPGAAYNPATGAFINTMRAAHTTTSGSLMPNRAHTSRSSSLECPSRGADTCRVTFPTACRFGPARCP